MRVFEILGPSITVVNLSGATYTLTSSSLNAYTVTIEGGSGPQDGYIFDSGTQTFYSNPAYEIEHYTSVPT